MKNSKKTWRSSAKSSSRLQKGEIGKPKLVKTLSWLHRTGTKPEAPHGCGSPNAIKLTLIVVRLTDLMSLRDLKKIGKKTCSERQIVVTMITLDEHDEFGETRLIKTNDSTAAFEHIHLGYRSSGYSSRSTTVSLIVSDNIQPLLLIQMSV